MWTPEAQARALALQAWEDSLCGCGCGQPSKVAHDPSQPFRVDKFTCYAKRAKERVERDWRDQHKDAPDGWGDGVYHYVFPVKDDRSETQKERARGRRRPRKEKQGAD